MWCIPVNNADYLTFILGMYHAMTWPQISFVAEDHKGRIVGYVLAKMCVVSSMHLIEPSHNENAVKNLQKKTKRSMATLIQYLSCDPTDVSVSRRNLCFFRVRLHSIRLDQKVF